MQGRTGFIAVPTSGVLIALRTAYFKAPAGPRVYLTSDFDHAGEMLSQLSALSENVKFAITRPSPIRLCAAYRCLWG
ncbi:hypothetical protein BAUCODRAFT_39789 [Baudoinia panamericana UAMH 10762]|uniref:Uncharacterized protein n=1 Tax=Baudoinia panamericana (strain UAMH 10762) TaxID=717646 RepID=M2MWN3_BAUPA|nr:uncharacterized protein BAUCODRAFT_39789 [Baudoinia panamericana UAMH 10762]EMC90989.1 hypothetical protein BAUCODRAFT_39789 [Baudoinia panamericana UAMH 10762]